jgi:hypothetical protein
MSGTTTKIARKRRHMVSALARQTRLLETYVIKAQADSDYIGEIAAKLRLLLIESRSNKALLFRVAEAFHPRVEYDPRPDYDHPRTWPELLGGPMFTFGDRSISFREVICRFAEQMGGVHEDWSVDDMLLKTQTDAHVNGVSLAQNNLTSIAIKAIANAKELLHRIERCEANESAAGDTGGG